MVEASVTGTRRIFNAEPPPLQSATFVRMSRRKQVYKITYPNGMIYVGMDVTGSVTYFGSPSAKARIAADLGERQHDYTARKQILWESDTATDAEVRAMEARLIVEHRSNDPAVGYNLWPKPKPTT